MDPLHQFIKTKDRNVLVCTLLQASTFELSTSMLMGLYFLFFWPLNKSLAKINIAVVTA